MGYAMMIMDAIKTTFNSHLNNNVLSMFSNHVNHNTVIKHNKSNALNNSPFNTFNKLHNIKYNMSSNRNKRNVQFFMASQGLLFNHIIILSLHGHHRNRHIRFHHLIIQYCLKILMLLIATKQIKSFKIFNLIAASPFIENVVRELLILS